MSIPPEIELEVRSDPTHHIDFDLNGAASKLLGFSAVLFGWAMRNMSSSTLATADMYDGDDSSGKPTIPLALAANGFDVRWFGPNGVWFKNAVYLNVTAQEIKGTLFYRHIR